jgi:hypothetical protein
MLSIFITYLFIYSFLSKWTGSGVLTGCFTFYHLTMLGVSPNHALFLLCFLTMFRKNKRQELQARWGMQL